MNITDILTEWEMYLSKPGSEPGYISHCRKIFQIPGSGRSPGEGTGNPLQYSYLENSMDRGAWKARVQGVAKS